MYPATPGWRTPGGTLSDKSASKEFGLTQEEIVAAIRVGKLQARHNNTHGNPYYKLLRGDVEAFVGKKYGVIIWKRDSLVMSWRRSRKI